jgi:hypothetical protein
MNRSKTEIMRCLRLGNLRTLLRARCGHTLPDDDAGREYLLELLLPVSLGPDANRKIHNTVETWAPWLDVKERFDLVAQIERTPAHIRRVKATTLGQRLRVTSEKRERLKLWTITPFDLTDKQLKEQRKAKQRARMRRLRQRTPRAEYLAAYNTNKEKPWEIEGISRRTWYRRRGTGMCALNLLNSCAHTCATEETARPQEVAAQGSEGAMSKAQSSLVDTETYPRALRTDLCQSASHTNGHAGPAVRARVWIREIRPRPSRPVPPNGHGLNVGGCHDDRYRAIKFADCDSRANQKLAPSC